ncbi:hypothetical protein LB506_004333 [Fusarium annulatum]|nr:hypothetical protein LB506_004333 [Fusarium annulatum]
MQSAHESNNSIIVEESSALMLDVNHSSYPFITLSDTTLGSIISGLTFNSKNITKTIGVVKASNASKARRLGTLEPSSKRLAGNGELQRAEGADDGSTSSFTSNHHNALKLTELDVLDTIETIKAAIAYKIDGARA